MRLNEGLRLRIKDVDFDRRVLVVREGKGGRRNRLAIGFVFANPMSNIRIKSASIPYK